MAQAHLLGTAQDAGLPQAGCACVNCTAAWADPACRRLPSSLGLVDDQTGDFYIIDATPAITEQLHQLTRVSPSGRLAGILLTHLHIGHYIGLAQLGRESMAVRSLPLFATTGVIDFLSRNEPWGTLVRDGNVITHELRPNVALELRPSLAVTPIPVPHRAEFSDTMAFVVQGAHRTLLYVPDIDRWESWDRNVREAVDAVDIALLDATFFGPDELPSRPLSEIPHPFAADTIARLAGTRRDVRLIHLNHSNPLHRPGPEREQVVGAGLRVGQDGDSWLL